MNPENKNTGEGQDAVLCGACGTSFPGEHAGKVDAKGKPLCIPCSLKVTSCSATSTTREGREQHQAMVEEIADKREKGKGSRRLVLALLLIAIPIIALEVFLLLKNRPVEMTATEAAEIELSEYMVMTTVIGMYYDENGQYPIKLEALIPEYWSADDTDDLEFYLYTQVSQDSYRLERTGSNLPAPLINEAVSRDLLPVSMTSETDFDNYFDRIDQAD